MRLEKTHASGAEEWYCPTCGRRFLMQWPPSYQKIILEPGDEYAMHSGSKGGMRIGSLGISEDAEEPMLSDELRSALEEVLGNIDFDDWPDVNG
jgi:hypothetical protein